ncbi:MAG: phage antirepressor KilAC domain-containing protein, partial [Filifactor alocis]|nr:phage antirepressor KilAC domain-containing protein [Filifactor alocis]
NTKQQEQIVRLAPKAEYTDAVLQSTSTYTFTQIAHDLGMRSVRVLMDELRARKLIYRQSDQWQPTAKVADKGYFATRTAKYIKSNGSIGTSISTVVTESGRQFIHTLISK